MMSGEPMFNVELLYGSIRIEPMPLVIHDDGSVSFPHRFIELDARGNIVRSTVCDSGLRLIL